MTQINPFTPAIIQSGQVPQRHSAEKDRQIRRLQDLGKNAALQGDRLEHQVESSDALHAANDGQGGSQQQRQSPRRNPTSSEDTTPDSDSHIDLTA